MTTARSRQVLSAVVVVAGVLVLSGGEISHQPPAAVHAQAKPQTSPTPEVSASVSPTPPVATANPTPTPTVTSTPKPSGVVHPFKPDRLRIPKIKVNAQIVAMPSSLQPNPVNGKLETGYGIPDNLTQASWWSADQDGVKALKPGTGPVGNSTIAQFWAHTALNDVEGVFAKLGTLRPGDLIYVHGRDTKGVKGTFVSQVIAKPVEVPKDVKGALQQALSDAPKVTQLAFGTCSGDIVKMKGGGTISTHHEDNTWLFAVGIGWVPDKK